MNLNEKIIAAAFIVLMAVYFGFQIRNGKLLLGWFLPYVYKEESPVIFWFFMTMQYSMLVMMVYAVFWKL